MIDIKSLTFEELEMNLMSIGEPKFRAKQIFSWLHKGVLSFDDMSNVSKATKDKLNASFFINNLTISAHQISRDLTEKFLFKTVDNNYIESVLMKYKHGNSLCISSQIGCRMGCSFCASTVGGLVRNLEPSEILDQILVVQKKTNLRVDSIVMMGIGEPLDNYGNVIKFVRIVNDKNGTALGMRHISISTCGIVPKIYELAELNLQLTLSISLHNSDSEERSQIMNINNAYPLDELVKAGRDYAKITGRKVYYEYTLIDGVNDSERHANELARLLSRSLCHVNLIALNPVSDKDFRASSKERISRFSKTLELGGVSSTLRRKLGDDIDAACGQLRSNFQEN